MGVGAPPPGIPTALTQSPLAKGCVSRPPHLISAQHLHWLNPIFGGWEQLALFHPKAAGWGLETSGLETCLGIATRGR